jgi:hypothetical protein
MTKTLETGLREYEKHLTETARVFNEHAKGHGLDVVMDPSSALKALHAGINLGRVSTFWTREDESGIIHAEQLRTAIECIVNLARDERRQGHVVGAMQSGKTTTSLALQWAGPILYRLTGRRAYPFYIIGNQRNHEDQTRIELDRFMTYYGHVEIHATNVKKGEDPVFTKSPSLMTYREHVLRNKDAFFEVPSLEALVYRRVGGERTIGKIVDLCRGATDQGYQPLMLIDEPQFGASDRYLPDGRRKCVLAQIFESIEQAIGSTPLDHRFIGLSATPFELNDLKRVWEVRQTLTEKYSGFNYFNGEEISPGVTITPPRTLSLANFGAAIKVPFLSDVSLAAYDKLSAFQKFAPQTGFKGSHEQYREQVEDTLRETIYAVIKQHKKDGPIGLCIRALNNNTKMQLLMERLKLDPKRIEVLPYYGEMGGMSVKRAIASRKHADLPYLVLVTNRARMADAFPTEVRFFMDLAKQSSDLNALLQGLLGRACGYGKKSTVVLSEANAQIVDAYVATRGGYVHKTSRHSVTVNGGYRRGAPTSMLKLRVEMDDSVVKKFFERIDREVVEQLTSPGPKIKVKRGKNNEARSAPILRIAEELRLFEHVEDPTVTGTLFPGFITGFHVARRGEPVPHVRDRSIKLKYEADAKGNCRFTFRHADRSDAAKGGAAGRAKGKKDVGQWLEPTIYVEKYHPRTKVVIPLGDDTPGHWRAFMVTFPFREPVREVMVATVAYPVEESPFDAYMEPDEREHRDTGRQRRGPAARATP